MRPLPAIPSLTPAPLQNRIRVALDTSRDALWALIGDLARFPEYSAGLECVDPTLDAGGNCTSYLCHFKPAAPGQPAIAHREIVRWYEPGSGYASSAALDNAFGLTESLNLVTLQPAPRGTVLTWDEYFEAEDVETNQTSYDAALADIADRLIARFGGRLLERFVRDSRAAAGPVVAVDRLADAVNRGDLEQAAALYVAEAVLLGPGTTARGDVQIREALGGFIRLRPTLSTTASQVFEVDDVALYLGRWRLSGIGPDGEPVTMGGASADVLRRESDDRWLIVVDDPWGTALLPDGDARQRI